MDTDEKLRVLGQAARYEVCDSLAAGGLFAPPRDEHIHGPDLFPHITHIATPGGHRVPILKVLQTSACQNNCLYCAFRAGRDVARAHFAPDELAHSVDLMQRAGVVQGLFLSSGVAGTLRTMDEMLATAELLRGKYAFRGYLHLKLLPGVGNDQIARAVELADRVSVNLEAPTAERLAALAPQKLMPQLMDPLRAAAGIIRRLPARGSGAGPVAGNARLGMSTQFVVGPAGESDRELLTTAQMLYRQIGLARIYYSAFTPVRDTPLAPLQATEPRREFRLYQADFLLRRYGFSAEELTFENDSRLSPSFDPKTAWARVHPERFPIEVNRASLDELVRIPGIGPVSARAILRARQDGKLISLGDLRRLGARADQAAPYITLAGHRPPWQMPLPMPVADPQRP